LSRIEKVEDDTGGTPGTDLIGYLYNGTSRVVESDYYEPNIESRAYNIDGSGGNNNYNAFDRFGREVKREWWNYVANQSRDRFDYTLDYAGNRLIRDIPGTSHGRDQVFGYDGLQRLKSFDEGALSGSSISGTPVRAEDWTLDQLGNWPGFVQKAAGSTTLDQTRYHNAVNEIDGNTGDSITSSTGTNWADPAYDAAGNMTTMPKPASLNNGLTLKFDAWNRMVEVKDGGTTIQTNEFDGLGRRIVRVDVAPHPDVTYNCHYNERWQLLEERKNADSDPLNQYVWHPYYIDALAIRWYDADTDGNLAENVDGEYYSLFDANFNVASITDNSGAIVERYAYTPYGKVTVLDANYATDSDGISDIGNTHFYTGRELDPETGLQLNRWRFYHLQLGRWVTRDPIEYNGGTSNLYEYTECGPVNSLDPEGKCTIELWCWPAFEGKLGSEVHCQYVVKNSPGGNGQCRGHGELCCSIFCDFQCLTSSWMPNEPLPNKEGQFLAGTQTYPDDSKCACLRKECETFGDGEGICYVLITGGVSGHGTSNTAAYCLEKACNLGFGDNPLKPGKPPAGWGHDGGCKPHAWSWL
jgi:RHS repeat-associated protein